MPDFSRVAMLDFPDGFPEIQAMRIPKLELRGSGVAALRDSLLDLSRGGRWPMLEPLPVTRFLGKGFGISNVSAFRVLNGLSDSGQLWRAPNGRYFFPEARRLLEKPLPLACLIRRLERWTEVGREIMQGVDGVCGDLDRAMLLVHDRVLFRQPDELAPASVGPVRELGAAIEDFLLIHSGRIDGVILDELWPDRVLAGFKGRLRSGVVFYRRTKLPFLGCVCGDVKAAARLAVERALKSGFQRLALLMPAGRYQPSDEMAAALLAAAAGHFPKPPVFPIGSGKDCLRLTAFLRKQRKRLLVMGTEDNAVVVAYGAIRDAGIDVPGRVGLLSTMGSRIARDREITVAGFDFRLMGEEAARMAVGGSLSHVALPPVLIPGATT